MRKTRRISSKADTVKLMHSEEREVITVQKLRISDY